MYKSKFGELRAKFGAKTLPITPQQFEEVRRNNQLVVGVPDSVSEVRAKAARYNLSLRARVRVSLASSDGETQRFVIRKLQDRRSQRKSNAMAKKPSMKGASALTRSWGGSIQRGIARVASFKALSRKGTKQSMSSDQAAEDQSPVEAQVEDQEYMEEEDEDKKVIADYLAECHPDLLDSLDERDDEEETAEPDSSLQQPEGEADTGARLVNVPYETKTAPAMVGRSRRGSNSHRAKRNPKRANTLKARRRRHKRREARRRKAAMKGAKLFLRTNTNGDKDNHSSARLLHSLAHMDHTALSELRRAISLHDEHSTSDKQSGKKTPRMHIKASRRPSGKGMNRTHTRGSGYPKKAKRRQGKGTLKRHELKQQTTQSSEASPDDLDFRRLSVRMSKTKKEASDSKLTDEPERPRKGTLRRIEQVTFADVLPSDAPPALVRSATSNSQGESAFPMKGNNKGTLTRKNTVIAKDGILQEAISGIVEAFFEVYDPERLSSVSDLVKSYRGREEDLLDHLEAQYQVVFNRDGYAEIDEIAIFHSQLKEELIQFLLYHDAERFMDVRNVPESEQKKLLKSYGRTDIVEHVNHLMNTYSFGNLSNAIRSRYNGLPVLWEDEAKRQQIYQDSQQRNNVTF